MPTRLPRAATPNPESYLPLNRDTFHILVSLADRDRHGYSVMQDVRERTDGALRLSPSSLYATTRDGALYFSTNGAKRWRELPSLRTNRGFVSFAFGPDSPSVVYAATAGGLFALTHPQG